MTGTSSASDLLLGLTDAEFAHLVTVLPPAEREALGIMRATLITLQTEMRQAEAALGSVPMNGISLLGRF